MLERAHRHLNARVSEREIGGKAPKYLIAKRECFSQVPSKPIKVTYFSFSRCCATRSAPVPVVSLFPLSVLDCRVGSCR